MANGVKLHHSLAPTVSQLGCNSRTIVISVTIPTRDSRESEIALMTSANLTSNWIFSKNNSNLHVKVDSANRSCPHEHERGCHQESTDDQVRLNRGLAVLVAEVSPHRRRQRVGSVLLSKSKALGIVCSDEN